MSVTLPEPAVTPELPAEITFGDVLERAADLLEEFGWCQGAQARDAHWYPCSANSGDAIAFCMSGALMRAKHDLGWGGRMNNYVLFKRLGIFDERWPGIVRWNDSVATSSEVVGCLREAARRVRAAGEQEPLL